jgi:cobalt/nickel transport protein
MEIVRAIVLALGLLPALTAVASAHFQVITPSTDIVTDQTGGKIDIALIFTHPMERGPVMQMEKPVRFGVKAGDKMIDLAAQLQPATIDGKQAWQASYDIKQPGDYVFFVEPKPYWEPAEGKMIIHYAKVVVDAYGSGEGWDAMVGLPVEIRPLVRPYGVWTGNVFRGVVLRNGKPVPFAEIEVEWMNDGSITPPSDAFITQVIKADASGAFSYAMPRAGWWGFAALVEGDKKMKSPTGKDVPVELGALMWVRAVDMK